MWWKKKSHPTINMLPVLSSIFRFKDLVSHSFALNLATGHLGNSPCFGDFLLQHIQQCGHVTGKECEKHHTKSQHLQNEFDNNTSTNQKLMIAFKLPWNHPVWLARKCIVMWIWEKFKVVIIVFSQPWKHVHMSWSKTFWYDRHYYIFWQLIKWLQVIEAVCITIQQ